MIISLIASKGGTGKTTSAVYLCCAAVKAELNLSVSLLDCDLQRSATDWAREAEESGDPLPFTVEPGDMRTVRDLESGKGLTVIDTAPGFDNLTGEIIGKSDLCIIPTSPSLLDLRRAWKTVDACGDKAVLLVTKANRRTTDFRATMESIDADGVSYFDTVVRQSVKYAKAFGTNPAKLYDYADVWQEIKEAMR